MLAIKRAPFGFSFLNIFFSRIPEHIFLCCSWKKKSSTWKKYVYKNLMTMMMMISNKYGWKRRRRIVCMEMIQRRELLVFFLLLLLFLFLLRKYLAGFCGEQVVGLGGNLEFFEEFWFKIENFWGYNDILRLEWYFEVRMKFSWLFPLFSAV